MQQVIDSPDRNIQKMVVRIISRTKHIRPSRLQAKASLAQDFGFDPVDIVDIILALEKNFHIVIPDEVPINTVGDFIDYVSRHAMQETY